MDLATVPDAPPAWKNSRATSWPAPISAKVPYMGASKFIRRAFCVVVRSSFFASMLIALSDTGERSEAKFGTFFFGHGPLHRFDFILDPHKVIAVEVSRNGSLNTLDE